MLDFTDYDTRVAAYALVLSDDRSEILLAWYNGSGGGSPGWTLPGGGIEFGESLEDGCVREIHEETGLHATLGPVITTDVFSTESDGRRPGGRPFRSVRIVYSAHVTGGTLGTLEVEGSTDHADWVDLHELLSDRTNPLILKALEAEGVLPPE
ncbi:NUDIX hydrolase [Brevibacterium litoralis]|uniref:NUDIX hydrolase n=1 Tax=Brevibacterium litoralis TaxID=3138935 RepID=UPI0032EB80A1